MATWPSAVHWNHTFPDIKDSSSSKQAKINLSSSPWSILLQGLTWFARRRLWGWGHWWHLSEHRCCGGRRGRRCCGLCFVGWSRSFSWFGLSRSSCTERERERETIDDALKGKQQTKDFCNYVSDHDSGLHNYPPVTKTRDWFSVTHTTLQEINI